MECWVSSSGLDGAAGGYSDDLDDEVEGKEDEETRVDLEVLPRFRPNDEARALIEELTLEPGNKSMRINQYINEWICTFGHPCPKFPRAATVAS